MYKQNVFLLKKINSDMKGLKDCPPPFVVYGRFVVVKISRNVRLQSL